MTFRGRISELKEINSILQSIKTDVFSGINIDTDNVYGYSDEQLRFMEQRAIECGYSFNPFNFKRVQIPDTQYLRLVKLCGISNKQFYGIFYRLMKIPIQEVVEAFDVLPDNHKHEEIGPFIKQMRIMKGLDHPITVTIDSIHYSVFMIHMAISEITTLYEGACMKKIIDIIHSRFLKLNIQMAGSQLSTCFNSASFDEFGISEQTFQKSTMAKPHWIVQKTFNSMISKIRNTCSRLTMFYEETFTKEIVKVIRMRLNELNIKIIPNSKACLYETTDNKSDVPKDADDVAKKVNDVEVVVAPSGKRDNEDDLIGPHAKRIRAIEDVGNMKKYDPTSNYGCSWWYIASPEEQAADAAAVAVACVGRRCRSRRTAAACV